MTLVFQRIYGRKCSPEPNAERDSALLFFFFFLWGSMKMPSNNDFTNKLQQDVRVLEKHQRVGRMHGYVLPSQFFSASPSNA